MQVEDVRSHGELQTLFSHIQATWEHLGNTEPHWSVLSRDEFRRANIGKTEEAFYRSGEENVATLLHALERNGIDYRALKTCLEYGCGLGRMTHWLAAKFKIVYGYDISRSHLQAAERYLSMRGTRNVILRHVATVRDIEDLPCVDLVYSVIVLQHNPPPVIATILTQLVRALKAGGVAYFQVPTYRLGYSFTLKDYLARTVGSRAIEMHVLPQARVFEIVETEGGRVLEVLEDAWTGARHGERSNTFLVQKSAASEAPRRVFHLRGRGSPKKPV